MLLTTVDRYLKIFPEATPGISKPGASDAIEMRINAVSRNVEKYLGRKVEVAERTEKFTPASGTGTKQVRVSAYPIESIESVSIIDSLQDAESYNTDLETGVISFCTEIFRDAIPFEGSIIVAYTGGMASDTADFIDKYPDIEMEILTQVRFEILRVKDIAMKSVANGATTSQLNPYGMTDSLIAVLDGYRKVEWA